MNNMDEKNDDKMLTTGDEYDVLQRCRMYLNVWGPVDSLTCFHFFHALFASKCLRPVDERRLFDWRGLSTYFFLLNESFIKGLTSP